ncbi:phospholipase D3-like [Ceratina calcarata]|uniref:Phospholipase D3-like n=1 Tax=Ceratina calcarata TaxID=156304 RepID=A0AAJ7IW48_9HYME|nr:phospholipase D3-like [Ceratina calcarata]
MSFFAWKGNNRSESTEHAGRNLQDGLFQIASQACHILVQVNNTHNVSYGGNNNVRNVAYSKCSTNGEDPASVSTNKGATSTVNSYTKYTKERSKDQDVVVLLPHRKNRTPLVKHKLSTVSENAGLELNPSKSINSAGAAGNANNTDDDFELWDHSGFMLRSDADDPMTNKWRGSQGWCKPSCIPITIILILIVLVVLLPLLDHAAEKYALNNTNLGFDSNCLNGCNLTFVETLPIGMTYADSNVSLESTYDSWIKLISLAEERIEIASFYWTMTREDVYPDDSAKQGEEVFRSLLRAGKDNNVQLKIAQNIPSQISPNVDTEVLTKKANAQVNKTSYRNGKLRCLANDYAKIFDAYWMVGENGKIPETWPDSFQTKINSTNPMNFAFMDNKYKTFVASSPPPFSPKGRTNDVDGILYCIERAEKFVYVALMDYFPLTIYSPKIKYWPIIDDALRTAAVERKVHVRLLISSWKHSRKSEDYFLKSLVDLTGSYSGVEIEVRRFIVPTNSTFDKIPFSRVNHNKYMVTDTAAYIGTSNWSGDYFTNTAGIGTVIESVGEETAENLRQQLEDVFNRDWYSKYSYDLNGGSSFPEQSANAIEDDYYVRSSRYILA